MTHGQSQAQFGYLFTFVLALFIAGCGGGGESSDVSSVSANELEVIAAPGQIQVVTVGQPVTLDASQSATSSGEAVTYAWSFRSKPHGSTATLDNPASATPTFDADLKGTYTVEVVVSARGVDSRSNIAYVEAVLDKSLALNTPLLRNHERSNSWCFECHIQPTSVVEKSGDHIATSDMCQACHSIFSFSPIFFADHDELFISECQDCHDGVAAIGKSDRHYVTQADCAECHELNTCNSFLNVNLQDCSYNHTGIEDNCDQCHVGGAALGKDADHLETTGDCISCHSTDAFSPSTWDHSDTNNDCTASGCHENNTPLGQPVGHPDTTEVTSIGTNCGICHNTQSFNMGDTFDHSNVLSSDVACQSCHVNSANAIAIGYPLQPADHPGNLPEVNPPGPPDCGNCHYTTSFGPDQFADHTSDAVMYEDPGTNLIPKTCASCHNGAGIIGKHARHVPTANDCQDCHTPGTFTSGVFDHDPAKTNVTPNAAGDAIAGNCTACHNDNADSVESGLPNNHIPTNNAECDVCHKNSAPDYISFAGATFDHSTIGPNTLCSDCHDGTISTGVTRNHVPIGGRDCAVCHSYTGDATFIGGFFDHTVITETCDTCHGSSHDFGTDANANDIVGTKPRGTHLPTTADCGDCHDFSVSVGFTSTTKFMTNVHANFVDGCGGCHREEGRTDRLSTSNGLVTGKANTHVPTNQDCDACHTTTDPFTTATFSHIGITGDCVSCHHENAFADIGALPMVVDPNDPNDPHAGVTADCGICHSTDSDPGATPPAPSFTYKVFDHTGNITDCSRSGCHGDIAPTATVEPNDTIHNNSVEDCSVCHVPGTFATAVFSHDGITDNCASCHGNAPTATFAPDDNIHNTVTTTQDCSACHNTDGFANAQFNHGDIAVNCNACHGISAIGKDADHVPTHNICEDCHRTTGFTPANFSHDGITVGCVDCHDAGFATPKPAIGHPTTNADCYACHSVDGEFLDGQMDHTGIVDNCESCHNGTDATGKDAKTNPAHLDTALDCYRCHTIGGTFRGGSWVHGTNDVDCKGCHNGTNARGKPPEGRTGHFITTEQCSGCHTTDSWTQTLVYTHNINNKKYKEKHYNNRILACSKCHTANSETMSYGSKTINGTTYRGSDYPGTCALCHTVDYKEDSAHRGNRKLPDNTDCSGSSCHAWGNSKNRETRF